MVMNYLKRCQAQIRFKAHLSLRIMVSWKSSSSTVSSVPLGREVRWSSERQLVRVSERQLVGQG